jgi:hypothetical protein
LMGKAPANKPEPVRVRCGGRKDEGFILSDERKLDPLPPLPHYRLIHPTL